MKPQTMNEILRLFRKGMERTAKDAISDAIGNYIPYAEIDQVMNVEHRTRDWLEVFFNGQSDEYIRCPMLSEFDCEKAREMVYQEHKEEIIELIGKDFEKEIEILKSRLEMSSRRY